MKLSKLYAVIALSLGLCTQAGAAALTFDDTNPNHLITVSANDFEFALTVNGSPFQLGLNNPASGDFSEANPLNFRGRWKDRGQSGSGSRTIYLVQAGDPTQISDILRYSWSTNGSTGTIDGDFTSDLVNNLGLLPAGLNPGDVFVENGQPVAFSLPFLVGTINSDVDAVPEPATLALVSLALAGVAFTRRRKA